MDELTYTQTKNNNTVEDDASLVALITAAICAYTNKSLASFRVVSFKKR